MPEPKEKNKHRKRTGMRLIKQKNTEIHKNLIDAENAENK